MCCWRAGLRDRCEGGLFGDFGGECVFLGDCSWETDGSEEVNGYFQSAIPWIDVGRGASSKALPHSAPKDKAPSISRRSSPRPIRWKPRIRSIRRRSSGLPYPGSAGLRPRQGPHLRIPWELLAIWGYSIFRPRHRSTRPLLENLLSSHCLLDRSKVHLC
jgi:hypothetical protein